MSIAKQQEVLMQFERKLLELKQRAAMIGAHATGVDALDIREASRVLTELIQTFLEVTTYPNHEND